MTTGKHCVIAQCWEIDGIPDGYSLHINESDRRVFVENVRELFETFPANECSVPRGDAYEIEVDAVVFNKVKASKSGINAYPDYIPC